MSGTEKLLTEISSKLDKILKLIAMQTVAEIKTEQKKIEFLDQLGFRPIEIGYLLNKSQENINVQLSLSRKKRTKKPLDNTGEKPREYSHEQ